MEKYLSKNWFCCGLIALFVLLLWGRTVRFDFVWDDEMYITQNKNIRSLAHIPEFFHRKSAQSLETAPVSYRPLRNTAFAMLNALGGRSTPQPWIFHLANVCLHALAALLLFSVALKLWEGLAGARIASWLTALGFAALPVNSEPVCWAKCLDDLLAAVFVLAATRALLRSREGGRGYAAALGWFLLAVFAKESAAPFAAVVFFILRGFHKLPRRRCIVLTSPFFAIVLFYLICNRLVMGHLSQCAPLSGAYGQTLIDTIPVVQSYLRLLLGIPPFNADYNFMVGGPAHPFFSAPVWGGLFVILAFATAAVWSWPSQSWRAAAFGILWMGFFLLPVSNLVPMMQYMAERFLYIPAIGFLLALGTVGLHWRSRLTGPAAVLLILLWAGASFARAGAWRNQVSLFVDTDLSNPSSWRSRENAVIAIFNLPQIQPFFALDPQSHKLMVVHPPKNADAAAMWHTLTEAHRLYPDEHRFTAAMGLFYALHGQITNAVPLLELAARQQTNDASCWIDLGTAYTLESNWTGARTAYQTALRIEPANQAALHRLRNLQEKLKGR